MSGADKRFRDEDNLLWMNASVSTVTPSLPAGCISYLRGALNAGIYVQWQPTWQIKRYHVREKPPFTPSAAAARCMWEAAVTAGGAAVLNKSVSAGAAPLKKSLM